MPHQFVALTEADDPDNIKLPGGRFENANESPDEATARELMEELGVTAEEVNLIRAGELLNDDRISRRHIYMGVIALELLRPSSEIHHVELFTRDSVPHGKNRGHILSAVALSEIIRSAQEDI